MNLTKLEIALGVFIVAMWLWALAWVHLGGNLNGPLSRPEHSELTGIIEEYEALPEVEIATVEEINAPPTEQESP
jgi:hypothetical protein